MNSDNQSNPRPSGRGGKRPGAGRPKGARDPKVVAIELEAQKYAAVALKALTEVAMKGDSESARVTASVALLDRGFGKPRQALEHSGAEGGPMEIKITERIVPAPNRIAHHLNGNGANGKP